MTELRRQGEDLDVVTAQPGPVGPDDRLARRRVAAAGARPGRPDLGGPGAGQPRPCRGPPATRRGRRSRRRRGRARPRSRARRPRRLEQPRASWATWSATPTVASPTWRWTASCRRRWLVPDLVGATDLEALGRLADGRRPPHLDRRRVRVPRSGGTDPLLRPVPPAGQDRPRRAARVGPHGRRRDPHPPRRRHLLLAGLPAGGVDGPMTPAGATGAGRPRRLRPGRLPPPPGLLHRRRRSPGCGRPSTPPRRSGRAPARSTTAP